MKILILLFCCYVLASCATALQNYSEPTSGQIATIEFTNQGTGVGSVEFFKEQETCKGRETSELIAAGTTQTIKVKAGSLLSFSFGYNVPTNQKSGYTYCRAYGSFNSEPNKNYAAIILSRDPGCSLFVMELLPDGSEEKVKSFRKREAITKPWNENSSFCK